MLRNLVNGRTITFSLEDVFENPTLDQNIRAFLGGREKKQRVEMLGLVCIKRFCVFALLFVCLVRCVFFHEKMCGGEHPQKMKLQAGGWANAI